MVHLVESENGSPIRRDSYLKTACGVWISPKAILEDTSPCTCNKCLRFDVGDAAFAEGQAAI
jgi:hypothetical protein